MKSTSGMERFVQIGPALHIPGIKHAGHLSGANAPGNNRPYTRASGMASAKRRGQKP